MSEFALSIKQPWATLIVHGIKKIEVRRWSTRRLGRVLIHAASVPDRRAQGWERVPDHLKSITEIRGGIIGVAQLVDCVTYRTADHFVTDQERHLNDPTWFDGTTHYGFLFEKPESLPFHKCPGWFRFFSVELEPTVNHSQSPSGHAKS